jgi:hypothetical protein
MNPRVFLLPLITAFCVGCQQPEPETESLMGVWVIHQIQYADGTINLDPEPSQAIFTAENYSLLWIYPPTSLRSFEERWTPTDAEKIQRYGEIVVNSGTYELAGDSLITLHPVVSRVPGFMGGGTLLYDYSMVGDTLNLTSLDEYSYDGIQAPWAASGSRVKLSLTRVEELKPPR